MSETTDKILDVSQDLVQRRGFNAFSYADIAAEVGIKTASIHYHFPSKGDLGISLVGRYRAEFSAELRRIDESGVDWPEKLKAFTDLYLDKLDEGKICLCGMLATDIETLPEPLQKEVRMFFIDNENWLAKVFRDARNSQNASVTGNVEMKAKLFFCAVQGAMLVSKAMNSEERFITLSQELLNSVLDQK